MYILIFLLLSLVIPVFLLADLGYVEYGLEAILAYLVILFSSVRIAMFCASGEQRLITMTFWVFVYFFLGLVPFVQLLAQQFPQVGSYPLEVKITAFAAIFLGLFSYEIGRLVAKKKFATFNTIIERITVGRVISEKKVALFCLIVMVMFIAIVQFVLGGLEFLLLSRTERNIWIIQTMQSEDLASGMILLTLITVPGFAGLILLWMLWINKKHLNQSGSYFGIGYTILFFAMLIINLSVNNPLNTARYWFGTIVLSLMFVTFRWRPRTSFVTWVAAIILALIFVFPIADLFRYSLSPDITKEFGIESIAQNMVESGDFSAFLMILNTVEYVSSNGIALGKQIMGTLLVWIPRSMWMDKPTPSNFLVAEFAGYWNINDAMPLWSEMYLDGGLLAVTLGFIIYGFFSNTIENIYIKYRFRTGNILNVFVPVFAAYQIFLLRGALIAAFAYFVPIAVFIWVPTKKDPLFVSESKNDMNYQRACCISDKFTL